MEKTSNFMEINLSNIRESEDLMLRTGEEYTKDNKLDGLIKSMQREGMLHPLVVRKVSDHEYELICGYRRFKAIQKKAQETNEDPKVMVKVIDRDLTEKDKLGIMVEENSMRKDFTTEELYKVSLAMDKAGFTDDEIAAKSGKSKKTVERMITVGKDIFFNDLVQKKILKYTQAATLIGDMSEDKLDMLKETVKQWITFTKREIEAENLRRKESGELPKDVDKEIHKHLKNWLIKNWHLQIKDGNEPQVDGVWRYGLRFDKKNKETSIPSIKISYGKDPIDRMVDIYWKLMRETKRIKAAIDSRKQLQEVETSESEYGTEYEEFIRTNSLHKFSRPSSPQPDADIPDINETDEQPEDEQLDDVSDFIDDTGTDE